MHRSRSTLVRFLVFLATVGIGWPGSSAHAESATRAASIAQVAGAPAIIAQGFNTPAEQPSHPTDGIGRVRVKSLVKLGLFIATIIGGVIAFLIRLASGRNRQNRPTFDGYGNQQGNPLDVTTGASGTVQVSAGGAAVGKPTTTAPNAARDKMLFGLLMGFGILALLVLASCAGVFLYFTATLNPSAARDLASYEASMRIKADLEAAARVRDAEEKEFFSRWESLDGESARATLMQFEALPQVEIALPTLDQTPDQLLDSGLTIANRGMSFRDSAPNGGILVGLRVTSAPHRIKSIQPIYQAGDVYSLGDVFGEPDKHQMLQLLAPAGEAVAAIRLDISGRVDGLQLEYAPFQNDRLDIEQRHPSRFIGAPVDYKSIAVIEGEGDAFVGVSGKLYDGFDGFFATRRTRFPTSPTSLPKSSTAGTSVLEIEKRAHGNLFSDDAPAGAALVGMRVFQGRSWGGSVQAVQPIYQLGESYVLGKRYGPDGGLARQVIARPGFALGAVEARIGLILNSLRFHFRPVTGSRLAATGGYATETIGSPGGSLFQMDGEGRFLTGVRGSFQRELNHIQFVVADP